MKAGTLLKQQKSRSWGLKNNTAAYSEIHNKITRVGNTKIHPPHATLATVTPPSASSQSTTDHSWNYVKETSSIIDMQRGLPFLFSSQGLSAVGM